MADPVDLDTPDSWPPRIATWVAERATRLRGSTEFTGDLGGSALWEEEEEFCALFEGRKLLGYHCTRLIVDEVELIRKDGLRRLTPGLVSSRIERAHETGHLDDSQRAALTSGNAFAIGNDHGRRDQVCGVLGVRTFDVEAHGVEPLMASWGGEGINGYPLPGARAGLRTFGEPSLVVIEFDPTSGARRPLFAPPLPRLFVGAALGLNDAWGEFHYYDDIPGEDVLAIWQPGNVEYDCFPRLMRT